MKIREEPRFTEFYEDIWAALGIDLAASRNIGIRTCISK
jgi:hypothetical protein